MTPTQMIKALLANGWEHAGEDGDGDWRTWFLKKEGRCVQIDEPSHESPHNLAIALRHNQPRFERAIAS